MNLSSVSLSLSLSLDPGAVDASRHHREGGGRRIGVEERKRVRTTTETTGVALLAKARQPHQLYADRAYLELADASQSIYLAEAPLTLSLSLSLSLSTYLPIGIPYLLLPSVSLAPFRFSLSSSLTSTNSRLHAHSEHLRRSMATQDQSQTRRERGNKI